jgi:hypothetical protein
VYLTHFLQARIVNDVRRWLYGMMLNLSGGILYAIRLVLVGI